MSRERKLTFIILLFMAEEKMVSLTDILQESRNYTKNI